MDSKIIVEKALRGEDYSKDLETLTDDEKITVKRDVIKALGDEEKKETEKLIGLRKAQEIVDKKNQEVKSAETKFIEDFKANQITKAKNLFYSKFQFKDEAAKQAFDSSFKTEKADAEMIFEEMKRHYAATNADQLLGLHEKVQQFEKGAIDINAFQANASGGAGNGGGGDGDKYSQAAKQLFTDMRNAGFKNVTLDSAQAMVNKGTDWKKTDLSK